MAQLSYNLIGYLPAPTFYGWVSTIVKDQKSHIPLGALLSTTVITMGILVCAVRAKIADEAKKIRLKTPTE